MLTKRFNALAILHEHKELTDKIDLKVVASEFASLNESRKLTFGNFLDGVE